MFCVTLRVFTKLERGRANETEHQELAAKTKVPVVTKLLRFRNGLSAAVIVVNKQSNQV
jgi:hypothetical protein